MNTFPLENKISFSDTLHVFWDWRLASISVEISFFGKSRASETVRVSIDGLVTLVDPEGVVTISGDGREIELDLRGCEFARAGKDSRSSEPFNALDPDSVLQVNFPHGEVCLVFPYRRVARVPGGQRRAEDGREWLRGKLASVAGSKTGMRLQAVPPIDANARKADPPRKRKSRASIFFLLGALLALTVAVLALTPQTMPKLLSELDLGPASLSDPSATVWVIRQEGNYYCRGGALFGRQPGQFMVQSRALALGYQPVLDRYCGSAQSAARVQRPGLLARVRRVFRNGHMILSIIFSRSRSWLAWPYRR